MKKLTQEEASLLMSEASVRPIYWFNSTGCPGAIATNEDSCFDTEQGHYISHAIQPRSRRRSAFDSFDAKEMLKAIRRIGVEACP